MTLAATVLLSVLPQVFPGSNLKLPPKQPSVVAKQPARPMNELDRFRRDLPQMSGPRIKVEAKLDEMGQSYPRIESLIIEVARSARAGEMEHLMPVARRFGRTSGTSRVSDELLFQLLTRRLGGATRAVVETMALLKGEAAKPALKQCARGPIPAARRHAVALLAPMCGPDDAAFALQLSREKSLDLRLRGVDLLGRMGGQSAVGRLAELLAKDPALAAAACRALIGVGAPAVATLQQRVLEPAVDRSFAYAAFALAQVGRATDQMVLLPELRGVLAEQLQSADPLTRVLVAVPLADLVFLTPPGEDAAGARELDRQLVEALMLVVEPKQFVPNLGMLRGPSGDRLQRHTGRSLASAAALSWSEWWDISRDAFLGVRARLSVTAENAGTAIVTLRQPGRIISVLGDRMGGRAVDPDAVEVMLPAAAMQELVGDLVEIGFGDSDAMRVDEALPLVRSLDVRVAGARSSVAVTEREHLAFDRMVGLIEQVIDAQLWQLYRIVADEPDRVRFWRQELRWIEEHDDLARGRRFVERAVRGWTGWSQALRARAIGFLAAHPRRKQLLTEAHGEAMLKALGDLPQLEAFDLQLLEIAATVPGDRVWRECIKLAITADGAGRQVVKSVFKVLGPDVVLSALGDERALVRRAAIDEVVSSRDVRGTSSLIAMLSDPDFQVQRSAVFACGQLSIASSGRSLVDLIVAEATDPKLRREALRALGRVGGPLAFQVLQKAMQAPARADKEAALRGLGELRDPRAAQFLCDFAVVGSGQQLGDLAKFHLQRLGGVLAAPALRKQIPLVKDELIRADLVLLLGRYQDHDNVAELMDLLRQSRYAADAVPLIECATGLDLANVSDRVLAIEAWWRSHKVEPQWRWLLEALRVAGVAHELTASDFAGGAGLASVSELCRLMVELETPRLWVLAAAVLRGVAGEDYGGVTMQTPPDIRAGIAGRYRALAATRRR